MSKLLRRAKVKRINAESSYKRISEDDAFLDDCCFNLQQAIEMTLKYLVEVHGGVYVENHDIRAQLNVLAKMKVNVSVANTLRLMADTINSWEASTRYKDNFIALIEDIDTVRNLADELLQSAEVCTMRQEQMQEMQVFPTKKLDK